MYYLVYFIIIFIFYFYQNQTIIIFLINPLIKIHSCKWIKYSLFRVLILFYFIKLLKINDFFKKKFNSNINQLKIEFDLI